MKKIKLLLATVSMLACVNSFAAEKVIATYNDVKVTEKEVQEFVKDILSSQPAMKDKKFSDLDKQIQSNLVKTYISIKLFQVEAKKTGLDSSSAFLAKMEALKQSLIQQEIFEKYIKPQITEAQIDEEYKNFVTETKDKDEVKASHILVKTIEEAKKVKADLAKGAKFAELVKKYSTDESSKNTGGSLGYFTTGQVLPVIEQKVFSMKINEVSEPIKTDFGWHILKLEEKRKVKLPSKEEAKPAIINKLNKQAMDVYVEKLLKEANTKVTIE